MRSYWALFAFGVFIFFLPFLGFPPAWKTAFLFIAGFAISVLSLSCIVKNRARNENEISYDENVSHEK
ncbi:MAG: hypothetical protein Q8R36_01985 [bacterium]|nr:hypothetical protein [bacterium]